jgi:hypothetical protein
LCEADQSARSVEDPVEQREFGGDVVVHWLSGRPSGCDEGERGS